jgi:hypothetical protein
MAGKSKARKYGINPATGLPWRFRAPRELRVVSSTKSRTSHRNSKCRISQIRLSGVWLERVGFKRGARFLVLADSRNQILLAIVDH